MHNCMFVDMYYIGWDCCPFRRINVWINEINELSNLFPIILVKNYIFSVNQYWSFLFK